MSIRFRPVEIDTGSPDHEGFLVFDDDCLVAILVRLSQIHEDHADGLYLEYGPAYRGAPDTFATLDQAKEWVNRAQRSG